ncbi:MAG TPA: chemotaxis protein CheW [Clostridiaceae bacterium]|nr:chemotaxis protein CheW [Clostridiaceae bacterium]
MDKGELKVLIFSAGGQLFAADIVDIERIIAYQVPARIPEAPEFVDGIINHEGTIIPVMSLPKRFNLENDDCCSRESKIILSLFEGNKIGIVVDNVLEVKTLSESDIDETPELVSGISSRYIKGIIRLKESMAILINLSAILTEEEKAQI